MLGTWMIYLLWSAAGVFVISSVANALRFDHPLDTVKAEERAHRA